MLNDDELEELTKIVRLRNLLVHRYWVIDDKKIYDSIKGEFRNLTRFLERIQVISGHGTVQV